MIADSFMPNILVLLMQQTRLAIQLAFDCNHNNDICNTCNFTLLPATPFQTHGLHTVILLLIYSAINLKIKVQTHVRYKQKRINKINML